MDCAFAAPENELTIIYIPCLKKRSLLTLVTSQHGYSSVFIS